VQAAEAQLSASDLAGQVQILYVKAQRAARLGRARDAAHYLEQGLQMARRAGLHAWEYHLLTGLARTEPDLTAHGRLYEQALAAARALGDRPGAALALDRLAGWLQRMGLYRQAEACARQALEAAEAVGMQPLAAAARLRLACALAELGDFSTAEAEFQALLAGPPDPAQAAAFTARARGALRQGRPQAAVADLQAAAACRTLRPETPTPACAPACQAAAWRLLDQPEQARAAARQAAALLSQALDAGEDPGAEPVEETCWWGFLALDGLPEDNREPDGSGEAWQMLNLGLQACLARVENMADAGLRRGYLHRVPNRRRLVLEWLRGAAQHGAGPVEVAEFAAQVQFPGRPEQVFRRLPAVGVRLNAQRDGRLLPGEIVAQVAELTGAERIALVLDGRAGAPPQFQAGLPIPGFAGPGRAAPPAGPQEFLDEIAPWLEQARRGAGFVHQVDLQTGLAGQRSLMAVPLFSQERPLGVIYADLRACFGRFELEDLDLLGVLANQAAVALDNAGWAATLESQVAQQTSDLQQTNHSLLQRNAELAILNRLSEAMSRELNVKAVVHSIGDLLREAFQAEVTVISLYDAPRNLVSYPYVYDRGYLSLSPRPLGQGVTSTVIATRQPLLLDTLEAINRLNPVRFTSAAGGDEHAQSYLGVPVIVGERLIGVVCVQSYQAHAFNPEQLRLLSTLTNSIGVALENARLFDETQRLLEETRQRSEELQIINYVSMALSRQLDEAAIIAIVGERMREIFPGQMCSIAIYNRITGMLSWPFFVDFDGRPVYEDPTPIGPGLTSYVIQTHRPLVLGSLEEARPYNAVWVYDRVDLEPKSWIGVPIVVGEDAIGVLAVQDMPEQRYREEDVRLLGTLASSMGVALENARLYGDAEQRAGQMAALAEAGREIAAAHTLPTIIEQIARRAHSVCRAR
ncbi:MAG: GAF domain-containing protein, partial [Chloroflexota bacterium]